jgi:hypothetical protein
LAAKGKHDGRVDDSVGPFEEQVEGCNACIIGFLPPFARWYDVGQKFILFSFNGGDVSFDACLGGRTFCHPFFCLFKLISCMLHGVDRQAASQPAH